MKIRTTHDPRALLPSWEWSAIDDDTYDGAPDAGHRAHIIGYGRTEAEAVADLLAQMEECDG